MLRSLTLHDQVAQLVIARGYGDYPESGNKEYQRFYHWVHDSHVGGFIVAGRIRNGDVMGAQPFEMAAFINHMQHAAKTPLLVGSDFERGASMRVAQTARFPYLMAFGAAHDLNAIQQLGAATAREARALGVNWAFAPDADVNNNPDNPIINTRSFGEDPQVVAADVGAFIEGAHSDPGSYVLLAAKHFPGHGDTSQDSHMQLARIDEPKDRIEAVELVPFRAAIAHDVDSIMTGHLAVPAFESQPLPATLSRDILTNLLRDELRFKGLVVTDALDMAGVTSLFSQGELAVRTLEAGADVLLMPEDPDVCIRAVLAAVKSGRITRARIDASAAKVLAAKQRVGLFRQRYVNLDHISDDLEEQKLDMLAQNVADESFTLVKDEKHLFPMPSGEGSCLVVMSEGEFSTRGQVLVQALHAAHVSPQIYVTHASMPDTLLSSFAADTARCKQVYVAAFITVGANRGNVSLQGGLNGFLKTITSGTSPVALISFGSPYLLRDFPNVSSYAATFSVTSTSEIAVARALLGSIPLTGKLPVSIPPVAKIGDGLFVPAQARPASNGSE
ncbi:MAG TPA: glycoside hydrolase family 3 N-terminal domain-containing protein [Bryobacteraceae bacterium]|nr:glycoside hydrolase family 3 N-terminal domain-containing protein [Bryobacteraceae bacterium]